MGHLMLDMSGAQKALPSPRLFCQIFLLFHALERFRLHANRPQSGICGIAICSNLCAGITTTNRDEGMAFEKRYTFRCSRFSWSKRLKYPPRLLLAGLSTA
jgi:hypothetical protein